MSTNNRRRKRPLRRGGHPATLHHQQRQHHHGTADRCFIMAIIALANSTALHRPTGKRSFFYAQKSDRTTNITETTNEVRFQIFLVVLTCLLVAIISFFYTLENRSRNIHTLVPIPAGGHLFIGIFAYFHLKFGSTRS